jgi:hypothetical protein
MFMKIKLRMVIIRRRPSRLKLFLKYWPQVFWEAASALLRVLLPLILTSPFRAKSVPADVARESPTEHPASTSAGFLASLLFFFVLLIVVRIFVFMLRIVFEVWFVLKSPVAVAALDGVQISGSGMAVIMVAVVGESSVNQLLSSLPGVDVVVAGVTRESSANHAGTPAISISEGLLMFIGECIN